MIPPPPRSTLFPYTTLFRSVRSVIITSAGDRIFCADADLGSAFSGGDVDTFIRVGNSVMRKIERLSKPVIAARSAEHTSELQSRFDLVCRPLLENKKQKTRI